MTIAENGFDPEAYHIYSIPAQEMSLEQVACPVLINCNPSQVMDGQNNTILCYGIC